MFTGVINKFLIRPKSDDNNNININIWNTPDDVLEKEFNNDECEYRCRFYLSDMGDYASYHSKHYEQLYINNMQWEQEQKVTSIFKGDVKHIGETIDVVCIDNL